MLLEPTVEDHGCEDYPASFFGGDALSPRPAHRVFPKLLQIRESLLPIFRAWIGAAHHRTFCEILNDQNRWPVEFTDCALFFRRR